MPERIQLSRRKGWRKPEGAVVVARPSEFGNPFKVGETLTIVGTGATTTIDRSMAVVLYRAWLDINPELVEAIRLKLAGKNLACWCPLDQPCHADVLLEIANRGQYPACPSSS